MTPADRNRTIIDGFVQQLPDSDPVETQEWIDSLDAVVEQEGPVRGHFLLAKLLERAHHTAMGVPVTVTTPYVNTIPPEAEPEFGGPERAAWEQSAHHREEEFTRAEADWRDFEIDPKTGRVKAIDKAKAPPAKKPRKPRG